MAQIGGAHVLCPRCQSAWSDAETRCPSDGWKLIVDRRGQRIAERFEVLRLLGVGGQGSSVWVARDERLGIEVALKLLVARDPSEAARFERGAILGRSLEHDGVAPVMDHGKDGELAWVSMRLLVGETLAARIGVASTMSARDAVLIADQVLAALEHAHAVEIVHRDLKPANLFLVADPDPAITTPRVKILDFGIARLVGPSAAERFGPFFPDDEPIAPELESEVTGQHRICGTPEYMAPEQILGGDPDPRSDLYALGVILYRLVSGQLPFRARTRYEVYHRHLHEPPQPLSARVSVPIPFAAAIQRALAKSAADRFPNAREMREVLRASVGLPPVKRPSLFPTELEPPPTREPQASASASALDPVGVSPLPSLPRARTTTTQRPAIVELPPAPRPRRGRVFFGALSIGALLAVGLAAYLLTAGESTEPPPPADHVVTTGQTLQGSTLGGF